MASPVRRPAHGQPSGRQAWLPVNQLARRMTKLPAVRRAQPPAKGRATQPVLQLTKATQLLAACRQTQTVTLIRAQGRTVPKAGEGSRADLKYSRTWPPSGSIKVETGKLAELQLQAVPTPNYDGQQTHMRCTSRRTRRVSDRTQRIIKLRTRGGGPCLLQQCDAKRLRRASSPSAVSRRRTAAVASLGLAQSRQPWLPSHDTERRRR